jgi:MtrB/PioB family decaheme-associated outer membrane protein
MNCPSPVAPGCLGTTGANVGFAVLMVPEPIDAQHNQVEARLSYGGEKLRLSGGYYGSFYRNANAILNPNVPGSLNNAVGTLLPLNTGLQALLNQPLALPPDNEAHQFDITGNYALTNLTRVNFKFAYAQAKQDQNFAASGFAAAPVGATDLGGNVVTTSAHVGLSSRPLPKLSVQANLQYRDRDDKTPLDIYNVEGTSTYTNRQLPNTRFGASLQASYQFSLDYRATLGANYEAINRGVFTSSAAIAGTSALRQKTDETGVRVELRRRMADDFSAALSLERSRRNGSNWLKDNCGVGVTEVTNPSDPSVGFATAIFMPTLADRQRDKARLAADWQPVEALSLQVNADVGRDEFTAPNQFGLRTTRMSQYSLDWDFALSDAWHLNGNVSYGKQKLHQARPDEAILSFDNKTVGAGLCVAGKLAGKIEIGADVSYIDDKSVYAQALTATAAPSSVALLAATGPLPDILFRQTRVTLFGLYDLDKSSQLRLTLIYQHSKWNDWTWGYNDVPFVYSDGSTVSQKPIQEAAFIGFAYTYRWR